ncbi:hypothetical protein I4U23_015371 [Adineta vaga]|nr:hypothetical protein I4U23_015371 [Adineta vaga]
MAQSIKSTKRKFDDIECKSDPFIIPSICYQQIFQQLPIESLISAALTCKTWYNILSSNSFCFNKNTKLNLSNERQLFIISNSTILRHINKIEMGTYKHGITITLLSNFRLNFTSLHTLKLCSISLTLSFITNLFHSLSQTLKKFIVAICSKITPQMNIDATTTCLCLLSSLNLLSNLTYFSLLVKSNTKIELNIEKYFKCLTKLQTLILHQDNYTWKRSRNQQLTSFQYLTNLKHIEWFEFSLSDLQILSSLSCKPPLQYVHLQETLITNQILLYLSQIPTITSLKSHRFSPLRAQLNINGFHHLLSLKETLKELEISVKHLQYDELNPNESDSTDDEYEVHITSEHIDILKQFRNLTSLSFNTINISKENMNNLLISMAHYKQLKILDLDSVCFPSLTILSEMTSLEELSLSYLRNDNREEYTDEHLLMLASLKNLRILELCYSFNLSKELRKQLKKTTDWCPVFVKLEEFIYNGEE